MDLSDIFKIYGAGLFKYLKGSVAVTEHGFGAYYPGIIVAEDAGVLLVSWWIGRYLAKLQMVFCIGGLQKYYAVFAVQSVLYAWRAVSAIPLSFPMPAITHIP